jgi:hypothetical protein
MFDRGDTNPATQIYDPVRNTWKLGTPNYTLDFRPMVRLGSRFILVGGASGDTSYGLSVSEYHEKQQGDDASTCRHDLDGRLGGGGVGGAVVGGGV